MTLYLAVTPDELELPLYVAETAEELAQWAGVKVKTVITGCCRNRHREPWKRKGGGQGIKFRMRKIEVEEGQ